MELQEQVRENAEIVRRIAKEHMNVVVDFDEAGVTWLDGYLDRQRDSASDELKAKLPDTLGSFLGECVRARYGGRWVVNPEYGLELRFSDRLSIFPLNKVKKQLSNADGDSVLGLYRAIGPMLARKPDARTAAPAAPARRPWWQFWKS
jgi:hypothetical protein